MWLTYLATINLLACSPSSSEWWEKTEWGVLTRYWFSDSVCSLMKLWRCVNWLYIRVMIMFLIVFFLNVVLLSEVLSGNAILCFLHSCCARYFMCHSVLILFWSLLIRKTIVEYYKIIYCDVYYIILELDLNNLLAQMGQKKWITFG